MAQDPNAALALRLRRLHHALREVRSDDLPLIPLTAQHDGQKATFGFDFTKGQNEAEVANAVGRFLDGIAALKDHLKVWCLDRGVPFEGENLIESNRSVAIIHDLWNRDKHGTLTRSRSKSWPELRHIGRGVNVHPRVGEQSSSVSLSLNPLGLVFSGRSFVGIDAQVVDKNGAHLGTLLELAEQAIDAWEQTLLAAGVQLPRPK